MVATLQSRSLRRGSAHCLAIAACCLHARMKEKPSLMLEWSKTRSLRDALRVEAGTAGNARLAARSKRGALCLPDHLRSSVDERF